MVLAFVLAFTAALSSANPTAAQENTPASTLAAPTLTAQTSDGAIQRELPAETESPEESLSRTELRDSLTQAIDSLSETYRPVFVLRDVEGLSTEETAEMLNLSLPAVKSRLLRARLQLRQKLRRFLKKDDRQEENHV